MAQRSHLVRTPRVSAWSWQVPRASTAARERWWRHVEPFWVPGLALFCLLLGHALFRGPVLHLSGKTYDYAQYLVAGTLFPAALFGVPWFWRWRRLPWSPLRPARRALAAGALLWCALFVASSVGKHGVGLMALPPLLALAQTVLTWRPWLGANAPPERLTAIFVTAVVAWTIAISFLLEIFVQPPVYLAGFVVALVLACSATWASGPAPPAGDARGGLARDLFAMAGIAFMSLRTERLFDVPPGQLPGQGALHHWAPWVGAAELMRQGGWLLWDVPSMYGFLSIVPLAVLPTGSPWQALYLVQTASFFVVGTAIYLTVRRLRPGWLAWCLALATAVAVPMFFATFDAGTPVGSIFAYPNHGPYRYLWCVALIGLLVWERAAPDGTRRQRWLVAGGCLVWAVGVLWSPESAALCSGVWVPAYALIALRTAATGHHPWRTGAIRLALPVAILAAGVGLVTAVYLAGLGRPPDWLAYLDYVWGLGAEVLVEVNDPTGSVLGLLLGYSLLATAAWYLGSRRGMPTRSLPLLLGLLGGFWAAGIYGFTRAYVALHPIAYVALAVTLVTMARVGREEPWQPLVRAATVPLLVLVLVSPFAAIAASPLAIHEAVAGIRGTSRAGFAVEPLLPDADPGLQALLAAAGVGPDDPVSFQGSRLGFLMPPWRPGDDPAAARIVTTRDWLPGHPYVSLAYLPEGRGATYLRRYIDRVQRGGWLIQHKTGETAKPPNQHEFVSGREPWFFPTLGETHVPTRIFENEEWQLVWFDYVGRDSGVVRPASTGFRGLPPLLPDVTVDGRPLAEQDDPALWVLPGAGLGWYDAAAGTRWVSREAELWVFGRRPGDLAVSLRVLPDAPPLRLLVGTGGPEGPANAAASHRRDGDASPQPCGRSWATRERQGAPVALQAGWNRVSLCLLVPVGAETTQPDGWFVTGFDLRTAAGGTTDTVSGR